MSAVTTQTQTQTKTKTKTSGRAREPLRMLPHELCWYTASPYRVPAFCPLCQHQYLQAPLVLPYEAEVDTSGKAARLLPGWAATGFLARWLCPRCGHPHAVPATETEIRTWGAANPHGWHLY